MGARALALVPRAARAASRVGAAPSHAEARAALVEAWPSVVTDRAPELPELQILQAQIGIESGYCQGSYKLLDHATGEVLSSSGPINNCGAVQTGDPAHGVLATDSGPSHVTADNPHGYYDHLYRTYDTLAEGVADVIRQFVVRRPTSWAYARRGDIDGWAREAHAELVPGGVKKDPATGVPGYFEQKPELRAAGTEKWIAEFAPALGEPIAARRGGPVTDAPSDAPASSAEGGGIAGVVGGIVAALLFVAWRVLA